MPDVFQGDPIPLNRPPDFNIQDWFAGKNSGKKHGPEQVEPVTQALVRHMRDQGIKKIGGVGYCFGAKYVIRHMGMHGNIDVGYVAHPSFVEESELECIKGPLSISAACKHLVRSDTCDRLAEWSHLDPDEIFSPEKRYKSEEILQKIGVPYQINLYSHVDHGFAVRADISIKAVKFAKEQAFNQAVQWFDEYLQV